MLIITNPKPEPFQPNSPHIRGGIYDRASPTSCGAPNLLKVYITFEDPDSQTKRVKLIRNLVITHCCAEAVPMQTAWRMPGYRLISSIGRPLSSFCSRMFAAKARAR